MAHFRLAIGAVAADFRAADGNFDATIARDLLLQFFVQRALDLTHFPAAQARHMDMIARPMCLVEMAMTPQVKQVEFVELEGEDHWLSTGKTRLQMLEATVKFLEANNPPGAPGAAAN